METFDNVLEDNLENENNYRYLLKAAVRQAASERGYALTREPGHANVWKIGANGKRAAIRTSRDRWIAFPPLNGGKTWKTLSNVDVVLVGVLDNRESPRKIEVYEFPADEVRERFNASYKARRNAGQEMRDNFGMWVNLDMDKRGLAISVGSGLTDKYKPVAVYSIDSLTPQPPPGTTGNGGSAQVDGHTSRQTIAHVLATTRKQISEIAGVAISAVKIDLKIES